MQKAVVLAFCLAASVASAEQQYDFVDFTSVEVKEDVAARIIAGPTFSVTANSIDGDLANLNVNQYGQWLVFSRNARWGIFPNWRQDRFEITITLPGLAEVKALDRAAVTVVGAAGASLRAEASNDGHLVLKGINFEQTKLVVSMNSTLSATGNCNSLAMSGANGVAGTDCTLELVAGSNEKQSVTLPPETEN